MKTIILDAESIPFVDISAVRMLMNTYTDLEGSGVRLVIAHDIGQVRDLLRVGEADRLNEVVYPTVQAAVSAVT